MTMHHGAKLGDAVLDMTMTDVNFVLERKYKESKTYVVFLACEGINFWNICHGWWFNLLKEKSPIS